MCRCFLMVFLLAISSSAVSAQSSMQASNGKLSGDVANAGGNAAIARAFVLVHQPEGKKDFIVKVSNGRFELSLPPGLYDVFVSASGFSPSCQRIKITAGQSAVFKPRLEPTSEQTSSN